ncbi:hypothetical protein QPK87_05845 [Kamptonema cortianum]|nr:hypothetical protein [Geitlerinema splendidum]MDK3156096.1 hypothetical protein [Kamptonema cortianum]
MNEAKRAYNILRGYVNREWERIKGLEIMDAWKELDAPAGSSSKSGGGSTERPETPVEKIDTHVDMARKILNVKEDASFPEIRQAFESISRRTQPENFPPDSVEFQHAQELLRNATWAYHFLTKEVPASEKRFRSLEIE